MDTTFAAAAPSDSESLLDLMEQYYGYDHIPYDRGAARSALDGLLREPALGRVWLIRSGTETVGYCVLTMWYSLEFRGRAAFIDELFVKEGWRGKGIGTAALVFLKERAKGLGAKALRLEVETRNADAARLYRKAGFEREARDLMTSRLQ